MIIHCIGPSPQIDYDTMPMSVLVTTACKPGQPLPVTLVKRGRRSPRDRRELDVAVEWDSTMGSVMRMTRLRATYLVDPEFCVFIVPMADSLHVKKVVPILVVIKASIPNSFVWVGRHNDAAVDEFLHGNIPEFGAITLLHRNYKPLEEEPVPGERIGRREKRETSWKKLMADDDD